ncbi:MAG: C39 family peptidase [Candidatus Sericytochromatia bacterium]
MMSVACTPLGQQQNGLFHLPSTNQLNPDLSVESSPLAAVGQLSDTGANGDFKIAGLSGTTQINDSTPGQWKYGQKNLSAWNFQPGKAYKMVISDKTCSDEVLFPLRKYDQKTSWRFDRWLSSKTGLNFVFSRDFDFTSLNIGPGISASACSYSLELREEQPVVPTPPAPKNSTLGVPAISQRIQPGKLGYTSTSIADYGCALVSVAAILNSQGVSLSPTQLNEALKPIGGFQRDLIVWSKVPQAAANRVSYQVISTSQAADAELRAGFPVIAELRGYLKGFPTHFVALTAKNSDGSYLAMDPWVGRQNVRIESRFVHGFRGTYKSK